MVLRQQAEWRQAALKHDDVAAVGKRQTEMQYLVCRLIVRNGFFNLEVFGCWVSTTSSGCHAMNREAHGTRRH